jgi:hypothetical protein
MLARLTPHLNVSNIQDDFAWLCEVEGSLPRGSRLSGRSSGGHNVLHDVRVLI